MRSIFFGFLFFLIWAAGARYYYVCEIKDHCGNEVEETVTLPTTLQVKYGEEVILDGFNEFSFSSGKRKPFMNDNNIDFLDKLAQHLNDHPEHGLNIAGAYLENESDVKLSGTFMDNLGLARAEFLRAHLVARGIDENRISLDYNLVKGDELAQPVSFSLYPSGVDEENPEEYDRISFTFHDMTYTDANFEFDSDVFTPGNAFKSYADSVATYLGAFADKSFTIIGHTDAKGTVTYNEGLGLRRAKSARQYFVDLGVKTPINVESRGKREPVAPNNTDANRQKNRRVNFKIE